MVPKASLSAEHRSDWIAAPVAFLRLLISSSPSLHLLDLKPLRNAATVHGYANDGAFRYELRSQYNVSHSRTVAYRNDEHNEHTSKYTCSLIIMPPLRSIDAQRRLWIRLTSVARRTTGGVHPRHRLVVCSRREEVHIHQSVPSLRTFSFFLINDFAMLQMHREQCGDS